MGLFRAYALVFWLPLVATADGLAIAAVEGGKSDADLQYSLEIDKSKRELVVRQGTRIARRYTVALGRGGVGGKRVRGDNKTPEGVYYVTGFNDQSPFDTFIRLNYPNIKDGFFGLQRALITRAEFDQIVDAQRQDALPPQQTPLGGAIGIHGLGDENPGKLTIQANLNWTKGCVALTNREIRELRRLVAVGTRVVIRE
ncbi:MAG: L,D-transpeptidase family protein [Gammaproteobacteria bacterium]